MHQSNTNQCQPTPSLPFISPITDSPSLTHSHTRTRTHTHRHRERERERERDALVSMLSWGQSLDIMIFLYCKKKKKCKLHFIFPFFTLTPHTKLSAFLDFHKKQNKTKNWVQSFWMIYKLLPSWGPKNVPGITHVCPHKNSDTSHFWPCGDSWSP